MVDTGVAIATDLYVKASRLEVPHQRKAASDGVRLALTKNIAGCSVEVLEGRRVQVHCYALYKLVYCK